MFDWFAFQTGAVAFIIAFAIYAYVMMDGFDLGIGEIERDRLPGAHAAGARAYRSLCMNLAAKARQESAESYAIHSKTQAWRKDGSRHRVNPR